MNLCLILQVLQCVVLMCLAKKCNPAAVRFLRPCGKPEGYTKNMEFVLAGDYCYAESKQVLRYPLKWETARQKCQSHGGDLAKFYLQKDWNDIITKNKNGEIFNKSDTYWIGGRLARKGGWWWGDADRERNAERIGRDDSKVPWDGGKMPTNRELNCLRIQHNLWYAASCNNKQHFLCQKPGLSAYNSKTLIQVNREKKDGGVHFNVRDIAKISCSARSEKGLSVTWVTKSSGTYSFTSEPGRTPIEWILGIDIQRMKRYKHIDTRCINFYNMTVKMKLMPALDGSLITCSNINRKFSSSSSSLKLFVQPEQKKEEKKLDLEVWQINLVWYAVLFVVLSIALFVLVRVISRKKKASRLEKNTLVGAQLSVSTVHERPRALPSHGALELPKLIRPKQASNVARSGTDSESLPSTYTKASKNSHVKAYSESAAF